MPRLPQEVRDRGVRHRPRFPALSFGAIASVLALAAGSAVAGPADEVSADRVMEALRALPTKRAALGDDEHRQGLRDTERILLDRLKALGYEPVVQKIEWVSPAQRLGRPEQPPPADPPATAPGSRDPAKDDPSRSPAAPRPAAEPDFWNNIYVDVPGKELPKEIILIGAHFDAVARAPGADDDGSGTAALLELARVLKDQPMKRTVRLVFFNLEEIGLVGSRQYVASHGADKASQERIVGMVSLEMIGYFCMEEGCQKSPVQAIKGVFEPPTRGDTLASVTVAAHQEFSRQFAAAFEAGSDGLKITRFDFMPVPIPDILRSDHAPFLALGIPAIMLTDTSNFRNPNYHKPSDTIETLDQDRFIRAVRGIAAAAQALAEPSTAEATPSPTKAEN